MSDINWAAIRAEYESGASLRKIAAKYGISKTYIIEKRNKEKWNRPEQPTTDRPSDKQEKTNRDANAALRAAIAIKLRTQKLTYEEIARRCGYANAKSAHRAIQRELQRVVVENVNELRREEAFIYDQWQAECSEIFFDKENKGRLFALDRLIEISRDRRKLLGLDVPVDNAVAANVVVVREMPNGYFGEVKSE